MHLDSNFEKIVRKFDIECGLKMSGEELLYFASAVVCKLHDVIYVTWYGMFCLESSDFPFYALLINPEKSCC